MLRTSRKEITCLLVLLAVFGLSSACTRMSEPTESQGLKKRMRDAYMLTSELYTYVWTTKDFFDPRSEKRIALLLESLSKDFHAVSDLSSKLQQEPGFRIALQAQNSALKDIRNRFESGNKEYANWRLRGLAQNCVACHSRWGDTSSFFADVRFLHGSSTEERLARAEYLIATRQFDAASNELFGLAEGLSQVQSGSSSALESLKLWLVVEIRVKDRPEFAAKQLKSLIKGPIVFTNEELTVLDAWITDLETSTQVIHPVNADTLTTSKGLLKPVINEVRVSVQEQNLVKTLIATRLLHTYLDSQQQQHDNRKEAMLLLSTAYTRLPILSLAVYAPLYLEQCIREFPGTQEAQNAYRLYRDQLEFDSTGSSGQNLEEQDIDLLRELRELAHGNTKVSYSAPAGSE